MGFGGGSSGSAGAALGLTTEQTIASPIADNAENVLGAVQRFFARSFVLPSTSAFWIITGLEHKNGITINGDVQMGIALVDATPPVSTSTSTVAYGTITQAGVSSIQRNSSIVSDLIPAATRIMPWIQSSSGTATLRFLAGANENRFKTLAYAVVTQINDVAVWNVATTEYYMKVYAKGVTG